MQMENTSSSHILNIIGLKERLTAKHSGISVRGIGPFYSQLGERFQQSAVISELAFCSVTGDFSTLRGKSPFSRPGKHSSRLRYRPFLGDKGGLHIRKGESLLDLSSQVQNLRQLYFTLPSPSRSAILDFRSDGYIPSPTSSVEFLATQHCPRFEK